MADFAVVTIVLGALRMVLSILAYWLLFNVMLDGPGPNPDVLKLVGFLELVVLIGVLSPLLLAIIKASIFAGILLVIAGLGLLRRRRFSRTLTFVLGAL